MPRRPSAPSPPRPTALLSVSVRDWQRRVERYLVRDPKTRRILRPIYDLDAERDERALLAMYSAYDLWGQEKAEREHNLKVAHRSRRNFWRLWAREVLKDCGFPLISRADELKSAHVHEDIDLALVTAATDAAKRIDIGDQRAIDGVTALQYAATLEHAFRRLHFEKDPRERQLDAELVTLLIERMLHVANIQLVRPFAERGHKVAVGGKEGAEIANSRRRSRAAANRATWLAAARTIHGTNRTLTHYAVARIVAQKFGARTETVRKTLPPKKVW